MSMDPIVEEVRKAGRELVDEANGDLGRFFTNLRLAQERYADRLTDKITEESESRLPYIGRNRTSEIHIDQS